MTIDQSMYNDISIRRCYDFQTQNCQSPLDMNFIVKSLSVRLSICLSRKIFTSVRLTELSITKQNTTQLIKVQNIKVVLTNQLFQSVFFVFDVVVNVVGFRQRVHELLQPLHVIRRQTLERLREEVSTLFRHRLNWRRRIRCGWRNKR